MDKYLFFALAGDLAFPPRCMFCSKVIASGTVCECEREAFVLKFAGAQRLASNENHRLDFLEFAVSSFKYKGPVAKAVLAHKDPNSAWISSRMAELICADIRDFIKPQCIDYVVGVPGYLGSGAHSKSLASETARRLSLPDKSRLLVKTRATQKQHLSAMNERTENVRDAFRTLRTAKLSDSVVLLVDDVLTSGNTLCECARALKKSGCKKVIGLTFCRAAD
ncbi:MAG: phosphoribosyltransferase family protein [Oscillospiraceae bacterium]